MRIIGYIQDEEMKITLLEMNNRISIKFERDLMEQTYKLLLAPEPEILKNLKTKTVPEIRPSVMEYFNRMHATRKQLHTTAPSETSDPKFPEIV